MTIKSFFADSVAAAMREARTQLGEEAMLLKSRRAPEEARHLGAYEVVFGVMQTAREEAAGLETLAANGAVSNGAFLNGAGRNGMTTNGTVTNGTATKNGTATNGIATNGLAANGAVANGVAHLVAANGAAANGVVPHGLGAGLVVSESIWEVPGAPQLEGPRGNSVRLRGDELYRKLLDLEFDDALAADFAERVQARLLTDALDATAPATNGRAPQDATERVISLEAERFFERNTALDDASGSVTALIGPAGGGKTSAVVRLAVAYGLAKSRRVVLLSAEDARVAAEGRLLHFASLLGVECHSGCGPDELAERVQRRERGDLILIDTPGYGPREMEAARPLAEFLAQRQQIEKHLVLPAALKADDLRGALERFEMFASDRLLFTRLDETERFGPAFSEADASGKAVSFLATGQQVPGDIVHASRFQLAALLRTREGAMASAA